MPDNMHVSTDLVEINLEEFIMDTFKKGRIVRGHSFERDDEESIQYKIKHLRNLMTDVYKLYSRTDRTATKKDFVKLLQKHQKKKDGEIGNFLDQLERDENLFEVAGREVDKEGNMTIKLKKLDTSNKRRLIKLVAKQLSEKMSKEQIASMIEEGIRRADANEKKLERLQAKLEKKDVKVEGEKGCFRVLIDDEEILLI